MILKNGVGREQLLSPMSVKIRTTVVPSED